VNAPEGIVTAATAATGLADESAAVDVAIAYRLGFHQVTDLSELRFRHD